MKCSFCKQTGHLFSHCLGRETTPHPLLKTPWSDNFLKTEFDPNQYAGLSLAHALKMFSVIGENFNSGNPWESSTCATEALVKRIGFWKAIGADRRVLSWLMFGLPLRFVVTPPLHDWDNHPSYSGNE